MKRVGLETGTKEHTGLDETESSYSLTLSIPTVLYCMVHSQSNVTFVYFLNIFSTPFFFGVLSNILFTIYVAQLLYSYDISR